MKKFMMITVMVAAVALPAMAGWITADNNQDATKNQESFQSTSTMQSSGSAYSSQVTPVGASSVDGVEQNERANLVRIVGPRRSFGDNPSDPGKTTDEGSPIGDAVLPLMLMAVMVGGVIWLRRRKVARA